jgi:hypothetical protein
MRLRLPVCELGEAPVSREEAALRLLTDEEILRWMESVLWRFAHTMPHHPHEYCLKRNQDPRHFERVVATIWTRGYDRIYLRRKWRTLDVGPRHFCWIHTEPEEAEQMGLERLLEITILVNRWHYDQDRLF